MSVVPAAVQAMFHKSRGELSRRITSLEEMVAAMLEGRLDEGLRAGAERDAHKLAGSLGMFGLSLGSELARELEQALGAPDGPAMSQAPRLAELVVGLRGQLDGAPSERHRCVDRQDRLAGPGEVAAAGGRRRSASGSSRREPTSTSRSRSWEPESRHPDPEPPRAQVGDPLVEMRCS